MFRNKRKMITFSLSFPLSLYYYFGDRLPEDRPHTVIIKRIPENKNRPRFPPARPPGLSCKQGSNYQSDLRMVASGVLLK